MRHDTPREIATRFFADVDAGRYEAAFSLLAPDVAYEVMAPAPYGGPCDRDGLGAVSARLAERLAEPLRLVVKTIIAEGERVAVEVESQSLGRNGKPYNNRYSFMFVIRGGLIVEGREYLDSAHYITMFDD